MSQESRDGDPRSGVGCWRCRHLAAGHSADMPYLCRRIGIRSRLLPSVEVARIDGRPCQAFEPKPVGTRRG